MASYWDWLPVELQERVLLLARVQTLPILLEDGLAVLREYGTRRLALRLREGPLRWPAQRSMSVHEYSFLYGIVYRMCTAKPPHNHTQDLYEFVRDETRRVRREFPHGSREGRLWVVVHEHVFKYLDRFYVGRLNLPSLRSVMEEQLGAPQ